MSRRSNRLLELALFAVLGALLFLGKLVMDGLPNIHPVGVLLVTYTAVFRKRALIPLSVFVMLTGVYMGFSAWWVPYLYVWLPLWGGAMLVPERLSDRVKAVLYPLLLGLHGLLFGLLYAPAQALFFHLDFAGTLAWVAAGFWFDVLHCIGNVALGALVLPLVRVMKKTAPFVLR